MGLESFKSEDKKSTSSDVGNKPTGVSWLDDFHPSEWNSMSAEEKTDYIRENYIEDYRPGLTTGPDWSWSKARHIACACGSKFFIKGEGTCPDCGLQYKNVGRTVVMIDN